VSKWHVEAHDIVEGVSMTYFTWGLSFEVATAWTARGPICCHLVERAGRTTRRGRREALTTALKCRRTMGIVAVSVAGTSLETRIAEVADASTVGTAQSTSTLANSIANRFEGSRMVLE
jgi:hypothetical protein